MRKSKLHKLVEGLEARLKNQQDIAHRLGERVTLLERILRTPSAPHYGHYYTDAYPDTVHSGPTRALTNLVDREMEAMREARDLAELARLTAEYGTLPLPDATPEG